MAPKDITNVQQLIQEVQSVYNGWNSNKHLFFRGHSNDEYNLIPTVFRPIEKDKYYKEKEVLLDFKQYAPVHSINYDFLAERDKILVDMRHYGMPTRLLDWTIAPLNALYFACCDTANKNGEVIVFNAWEYWSRIIGSKKDEPEIHQIHILSRSLLSGGWGFKKINSYISRYFGYDDLKEEDILNPFPFVANYTNDRILHQRGVFTIQGLSIDKLDIVEETNDLIKRFKISASFKQSILEELNQLNVNHYSIYPDFEGMSEMLKRNGSLFNIKLKM